MENERPCPDCGGALDPTGACPACLMGLALDREPVTIGPYRVTEVLGEGGMGVVYLAEQSEPIARKVALKVIKHGMDTRAVVARFEAERQALARMDHPAIARIYEAGETEDGRPYVAMEYIDGEPIVEFCDRRRLGTVERLELFRGVCDGVQHAHRRGVIHRDLKPSNILVADIDGRPQPRIIDFGVAKAVERPPAGQSRLTAMGVLLGTPEYMSPEQAALEPGAVDTRSDVYSLGVVLYELLTGALPFDVSELRLAAFDEVRRRIREVRPSAPSRRLTELGRRAAELARSRRTDVSKLARRLSGELDLITMKALEKERDRRYGSPSELAADIDRHLTGEPVLARPPSAAYLLRKAVGKHRLTSALIAATLVTAVGAGIWLAVVYRRAIAAEEAAHREATRARRVSDFLVGVFEVSDPGRGGADNPTARELLDVAARRIDEELADEPRLQSTLMGTMGRVYAGLGLYDRSESLLRESLDRERSPDVLAALAATLTSNGRYDDAEPFAREAIADRERTSGKDSLDTADALEVLQTLHWRRGEQAEALELGLRIHAIRDARLGGESLEVAQSYNSLGNIYLAMGRYDDAASALTSALRTRKARLGPDHPGVGASTNNLAETYRRQANYPEAEAMFLEVQRINALNFDPAHVRNATAFNNLGLVYKKMKRHDEAVEQFRRAIEIREAALPPGHPLLAWTLDNLGLALRARGDYAEAEEAILRALDIAVEAVGPEHPDTLIVMTNVALLQADQEKLSEAESMFREVLRLNRKVRRPEHPEIAFCLHNLAKAVADQGRAAEAIELYREALDLSTRSLGADHPDTVDTRSRLEALQRSADSR